jgi:hypothetical protein
VCSGSQSMPCSNLVLFGASASAVPQADSGTVSAAPRLVLGTPERSFSLLPHPAASAQ